MSLRCSLQLRAVEKILADHEMADKPRLVVLNKSDAIEDPAMVREVATTRRALVTSTLTRDGLPELMATTEAAVLSARLRAAQVTVKEEEWTPHEGL